MIITPKEDIARIQKSARSILKQIHGFCEKYNIKYTAWGGTLIGTIRHQGMIPWDDDIDIVMLRNDFERFKQLFIEHQDELPNLFLQTSQTDKNYYFFGFAKIRDLQTKGRENLHAKMPFQEGVFLDVFPIDSLPGTSEKADRKFRIKVQILELFLTIKIAARFPPKLWQKIAVIAIMFALAVPLMATLIWPSILMTILNIPFTLVFAFLMTIFVWPYASLVKRRDKVICKYKDNLSSHVGMFLIQNKNQYRMPREWFESETKLMPFDDIQIRASIQYDAILKKQFGNYMKFPPIDKQNGKHAYVGLKTKFDDIQ